MKKITLLFSAFIFSFIVFGQTMPIDFSDVADNFTPFGGSGFSLNTDPDDAANPVGQFDNNVGDPWQGFFTDVSQPVNLDVNKVITLSFYQSDTNNHSILLKLEGGVGPDVEVVKNVSGQGWKRDLSFDFSNATESGTANTVNASGNYSRVTIFIDGGSSATGSYLIDDINDGSDPSDPNELDVIYDQLVWADEFDGANGVVNGTNWFHQTQLPAGGSWFNGEEQHYTNRIENSFVDNGFLNIVAIKEQFTDQGETKSYTSARLNSKYAFTYGRVDVRARLPFGDGTWPAIWTLGKNINEAGAYWETQGFGEVSWPACGELDIMEHGLHADNEVSVAIHTPSSFGATVNTAKKMLSDVANDFHVYSMNWSPNEVAFMVDDEVIYRYNPAVKDGNTWPFDEDQYLILNIAMGGISGTIDPNFSQSSMVIDYVRVYQNSQLSTEEFAQSEVSIYPNPANDLVYLKSVEPIDRLEVYNTLGQTVLSKSGVGDSIDVSGLARGMYVMTLHSGQQKKTSLRFVKN